MEITLPKWVDKMPNRDKYLIELLRGDLLYKIGEHRKKIELFEKKWGQNFKEFQEKVHSLKEEDFEMWDDLIIWEGYQTAYDQWMSRYEETLKCMKS